MKKAETIMGFISWDQRFEPSSPYSMIKPTLQMNENNETDEKTTPENIIDQIDKKERETEELLAERRRLRRLIRKNIQILRHQLANWDYIRKIRKKYHKTGRLSIKRKRDSRK